MIVFVYFFAAFFLLAGLLSLLIKKPFIVCLGNMFMLAAVVLVIWSQIIDDGSRRGMESLVLLIMWGFAAGSFVFGFFLRWVGRPRKQDGPEENGESDGVAVARPDNGES